MLRPPTASAKHYLLCGRLSLSALLAAPAGTARRRRGRRGAGAADASQSVRDQGTQIAYVLYQTIFLYAN